MFTVLQWRARLLVLLGVLCVGVGFAAAQTVTENDVLIRRAKLQAQLAQIEREIEEQRTLMQNKQKEAISLERDMAILNAKIKKARLGIRARNLRIAQLIDDIRQREHTIGSLTDKLEREKESLAQILRKTNEVENVSVVEVLLASDDLSDFFVDLDDFESIQRSLEISFRQISEVRDRNEAERRALEEQRQEEVELRVIQTLERDRLVKSEAEKARILRATRGEEAAYQKLIKEKEQTAAEIRTALFSLRGSSAIPFGKALTLANKAYQKTGVRPAFLLGIIAEESNLGQNVGTGNWREDMHPERDVPVFLDIVKRLGLDPDKMPVSKKPWYGWGGAMGPAQFIPSTWVLYEDKIAALTGHNPPNPWDPEDAFMASAILLRDNGAAKGGYANERLAALRYLAGWKNATKPAYAFYGDDVMALAAKYQKQIDILSRAQ